MKRFVRLLALIVRRAPLAVLIGSLVVTVILGSFIRQQERSTGNEGFSPDSDEFRAGQIVAETFDASSIAPVQVIFEGGDLFSAEGLRTYVAVRAAIERSRASELFLAAGSVQGYLDPATQVLEERGVTSEQATDSDVKSAWREGLAALPPEASDQVRQSLSEVGTDLAVPQATKGLMIVLLNSGLLEDDPNQVELQKIEVDMADRIAEVPQAGVRATPFSFALLFADAGEFQAEIGRLFGTAFLIILAILAFVFWVHPKGRMTRRAALRRAVSDVALALGVIVMSITWMNGIGVLLGPRYLGVIGKFNEILQIIPILLIGLGVDYAIHLSARYREELGAGASVSDAATRATRTVGVALVLATVTTAVGFLTNIISPVTAVKDFGILAAVGMGSAFMLMLTFVPSVRVLLDRRAERAGRLPIEAMGHSSERLLPTLMGKAAVFAERVPAIMLTLALTFGGAGLWGLLNLDTTFSFTDFLPADSPLLATYESLTSEFGGGLGESTSVLIEGEVASADSYNALLAATGRLADTPDVVQLGGRAAVESPITIIERLVTPPDRGGVPEIYDGAFAALAAELGLRSDLTMAPDGDVAALYQAAQEVAPDSMRRVVAVGDSGALRYVNVVVSTKAGESRAEELAADLRQDFVPVDAVEGVTAIPTNENIIARGVVKSLQASQVSSITITLITAMLLLVITFFVEARRPFLGVLTITPVALVVLWVFGMMALTGISFNPVTAMIAAVAIGIGVPYTIHITHRYQEDRLRYDNPEDAIRSTMTHTGGALAGSAFTTVAGFGILVTSTLKPFQQFGLVTGYAIGLSLVASILVLPSMLVLWDRWHRRRGEEAVDAAVLHDMLGDQAEGAIVG